MLNVLKMLITYFHYRYGTMWIRFILLRLFNYPLNSAANVEYSYSISFTASLSFGLTSRFYSFFMLFYVCVCILLFFLHICCFKYMKPLHISYSTFEISCAINIRKRLFPALFTSIYGLTYQIQHLTSVYAM